MSPFGAVVVYIIVWWMVIFTVLPWGSRAPARPELGHDSGAPENARLPRKLMITTVIATVIWGLIFAAAETRLIDVQAWARTLVREHRLPGSPDFQPPATVSPQTPAAP